MSKKPDLPVRLGRGAFGILLLLVLFGLGMWLGKLSVGWTDQFEILRRGVPVLGLGLLLGLARQLIFILGNYLDFVNSGNFRDLWKPATLYFFTGLTAVLALHLLQTTVDEVKDPSEGTIVIWSGPRVAPPATGDSTPSAEAYAVFPIFFAQEAGGFDAATEAFTSGTSPTVAEGRLIRSLVRGLLRCGQGQAGEVKLSVRGFASSSGYRGSGSASAADFNLKVANSRAESVMRVIESEVGSATGVSVELVEWASFEEMAEARSFDDEAGGEYVSDVGFLNRRADILLEDPGGCRLSDFEG